ncbi:MAG TPA: peptide-methionine (S)-S-oxide reductase MsrA [Gemmatimonadaceae bacterium]|nr:peptide-methionine (S)-S-oxide reductase MsrA [Gemmatimonadaceae bacterium]
MYAAFVRTTSLLGMALGAAVFVARPTAADAGDDPVPNRVVQTPRPANLETAVLAGGCFWGMQLVFEHVKGVTAVAAGYAGGDKNTATYPQVETGQTGHAESVRIVFDTTQVTYRQILQVYFTVAHDPTELNRQGPDVGTQYRSAIFYTTREQQQIATAYIAQLDKDKTFDSPIVTQVVPLKGFYPAEKYHQNYAVHHPDQPYIVINDLPKVASLREQLPALYRDQMVQATS